MKLSFYAAFLTLAGLTHGHIMMLTVNGANGGITFPHKSDVQSSGNLSALIRQLPATGVLPTLSSAIRRSLNVATPLAAAKPNNLVPLIVLLQQQPKSLPQAANFPRLQMDKSK
jgi:hypothetical protein